MTKKRSLGVTLLGWFEIIMGIIGGGCLFLYYGMLISYYLDSSSIEFKQYIALYSFTIFVFCFFFMFFLGKGILKLRKWAWKWNLFICPSIPFSLVIYIYIGDLFLIEKKSIIVMLIDVFKFRPVIVLFFIAGIIMYYLTCPKVRAQFFEQKLKSQKSNNNQEKAHDPQMD